MGKAFVGLESYLICIFIESSLHDESKHARHIKQFIIPYRKKNMVFRASLKLGDFKLMFGL